MSFAGDTKEELCKNIINLKDCCRFAAFYGMLLFSNTFSKQEIKIITEKESVKNLALDLCESLFGFSFSVRGKMKSDNDIIYTLRLEKHEQIVKILNKYGHDESTVRINFMNIQSDCCQKAFLKGAFLTGGSITDPGKRYHFEFATSHLFLFNDMKTLLMEKDMNVKNVIRKGYYVIYFKESESIEDMLTLMDATSALFRMMDIKIVKDIRNHTNRVTNCETANITKTVNASSKHTAAIELIIEKNGGLENLDDDVKAVAKARLENPEDSLAELGEKICPKMSKSAVNHRLKKLLQIAEEL